MLNEFRLRIDLGNSAMQTAGDVAAALRDVAARLDECPTWERGDRGNIVDKNGNTVGTWKLDDD